MLTANPKMANHISPVFVFITLSRRIFSIF
jgi:hypothetical protein